MAERSARTPKRRGEKALARSVRAAEEATSGARESVSARLDAAERECERLRAALAQAQEQIRTLEEQRAAVVDRIDWMIDTLHSLVESR